MALKMTNREVDGVAVVALDGRIVLGEESNALREKVKSLIAGGKKKKGTQTRAPLTISTCRATNYAPAPLEKLPTASASVL